jgi:hypothetical protein
MGELGTAVIPARQEGFDAGVVAVEVACAAFVLKFSRIVAFRTLSNQVNRPGRHEQSARDNPGGEKRANKVHGIITEAWKTQSRCAE